MRAGIYVRQSLDVQEGIERQRSRCASLVAARGWESGPEYLDNDTSASKLRGPATGWGRLLSDAQAGRIDVVVATDLDRLLRDTRDLAVLIDTGVKVLTVDGEIDLTSADGEFRATMLAGIARFEVRRKSERQVRANEARAKAGRWVGGRRPFGFEADGVTVNELEAAAVRDGYRDLLLGVPLAAIARQWNEAGFTTGQTRQARSGHAGAPSPWRADAVRVVLRNPRYMGRVRYKGELMAEPAEWPALVDEATFAAAQAVLENPARRSGGRSPSRLLTGLAVCGVAGCSATTHAGGNSRPGVASYRCSGSLGHYSRMAEPVEEFVEALVVGRLSRPDARDLLMRRPTADTEALHLEAVGLRERQARLATMWADGDLDDGEYRVARERLRDRLLEVEADLADAGRVDVLGDLVAAEDASRVWEGLSLSRKRAVVQSLMRVTLHPPGRGTRTFRPETVGIDWLSDS